MPDPFDDLVDRFRRGDRRALARLVTRVEEGRDAERIAAALAPPPPAAGPAGPRPGPTRPLVVGLTGSGGVGKSTLAGRLIEHLRGRGERVAVLCSDPASPFTGGALLGDRVRMDTDPADDSVFIRSLSTRGATGGISRAVPGLVPLLAAFGFGVILVETVGVGQDQLAVRDIADVLVVMLAPGGGDEIQWEKAGLLEAADIVAVNKADTPGAEPLAAQLRTILGLGAAPPPVLALSASTGQGIAELWQAIDTAKPRLRN